MQIPGDNPPSHLGGSAWNHLKALTPYMRRCASFGTAEQGVRLWLIPWSPLCHEQREATETLKYIYGKGVTLLD